MLHLNKKIKITIFAIAMTVAFCQTNAQQNKFATLNHNDTITAFYGDSALCQAHAAAVGGDIITLSSGSFLATNLTKPVTIRGAGMFADTAAGTQRTIVNNDFSVSVFQDSVNHLSVEGIYFLSTMYVGNNVVYDVEFSKCRFNNLKTFRDDHFHNSTFINCIIGSAYENYAEYSYFINTVILHDTIRSYYANNNTFSNCYIYFTAHWNFYNDNTFENCIISSRNSNAYPNSNHNCIGVGASGNGFFKSPIMNNNHNINSLSSVFKTFNGTYIEGETFELQDSIANNYLGTDSTQVGIYGGMVPFDPRVSPNIRRCNVGLRSTADGKLNVDIEVVP